MMKTLSFALVAIVILSSLICISSIVSQSSHSENSIITLDSKNIQRMNETTSSTNDEHSFGGLLKKNNKIFTPDITGVWYHENSSKNYSIEVTKQYGNNLEFNINATNDNSSKTAISGVYATLNEVYDDGDGIKGEGSFRYTDSFGNKGTGTITASKDSIILVINEEHNSGSGWSIAPTTGKYIK